MGIYKSEYIPIYANLFNISKHLYPKSLIFIFILKIPLLIGIIKWICLSAQRKGEILNKLDLSDRESIAIGIVRKQPLSSIGNILNRSTSSISREIKKHRIFVAGSYYAGNDCKNAKHCTERHLCGDLNCPMYCYSCNKDCHQYCKNYVTTKCLKYNNLECYF